MSNDARRGKRLFAGFLAAVMALSVAPVLGFTGVAGADQHLEAREPIGEGNFCEGVPNDNPFTDVTEADPSYEEILCLVATEVTVGTGDGTTYEPLSFVTRRQMAMFLKRTAQEADRLEVGDNIQELPAPAENEFPDVEDEEQSFQDAISQITQAGIAMGFEDGTYRPAEPVTRRQMAAFIDRLYTYLTGDELPASDDYFADDEEDSAEAQASTNAVAEAGIFIGNADGTFGPAQEITRRQMANVLTRTFEVLFENGEIEQWRAADEEPVGVTGLVSNCDPLTLDTDDGESTALVIDDAATYTVDGAAASAGAFAGACSVGDELTVQDTDDDGDVDILDLVNQAPPTSGVAGAIDTSADEVSIVTLANNVLNSFVYTPGLTDGDVEATAVFYVDGAPVALLTFEANLSHGDTIEFIDTDATPDGVADEVRLTNADVTGTVADVTAADIDGDTTADDAIFMIDALGDFYDDSVYDSDTHFVVGDDLDATQAYEVDGEEATVSEFIAALSDGDTITYSRVNGIETFVLTNSAPVDTSFSGITDDNTASGADTIGYISGTTQDTFVYTGVTNFVVNGVVSTQGEFETALDGAGTLPFGEAISYDEDSDTLSLTTATTAGPLPIDDVTVTDNGTTAGDTFDVVTADGLIVVDDLAADEVLAGSASARYFVNGAEVSAATYEDYLLDIVSDGDTDGDSFTVVLTALATEHRLTTDNTL